MGGFSVARLYWSTAGFSGVNPKMRPFLAGECSEDKKRALRLLDLGAA